MTLFSTSQFVFFHVPLLLLSFSLSGCFNPAPEPKQEPAKPQQKQEVIIPDLNQICENLKNEMLEISPQRTTFALEQINQSIRVCLPLISHAEQKKLMSLSDQMYAQFLQIDRTPEQQKAFDQYALDESQFPTIQQSHFEKLNIRDQYLLRHKGQAYIELSDLDQNNIGYKRNTQYLARVFAPYFPKDEQVFIQNLADQNEHTIFNENTLLISPEDIAQRALFWENYLKQYPQSSYQSDAQYLYNAYQILLFVGTKDSKVSYDYDGKFDIQAQSLASIEQLSKQKDSRLADKAKLLLKFIEMSPEQKAKALNRANPEQLHQTSMAKQVLRYLNIKDLNLGKAQVRDCFSDAICRQSK